MEGQGTQTRDGAANNGGLRMGDELSKGIIESLGEFGNRLIAAKRPDGACCVRPAGPNACCHFDADTSSCERTSAHCARTTSLRAMRPQLLAVAACEALRAVRVPLAGLVALASKFPYVLHAAYTPVSPHHPVDAVTAFVIHSLDRAVICTVA